MGIMLRKKKLKGGKHSLYLDIYHNHTRHYEFLDFKLNGDSNDKELLRLATTIKAKRELELHSDSYELPSFKRDTDFYKYADSVIAQLSPNTVITFQNALCHLKNYWGEHLTFESVTMNFCKKFSEYLLGKVSPNSAITYFAKFKTILNHAIADQIVTSNPSRGISIRGTETLPKFLTLAELQQLSNTPYSNEHVRNAFLFACFCGLRYSDVVKLEWCDVDFDNQRVRIIEKKTKSANYHPLCPLALSILQTQKNAAPSLKTKRIYKDSVVFKLPIRQEVNDALTKWGRKATLNKDITFHVGRHTFATLLLSSGVDLYTVSKLLGHRDIKNTTIYAKVIDERKIQAVAMLPKKITQTSVCRTE